MNDSLYTAYGANLGPPMPNEADLLPAMAESEAEAEAGLFVSGDEEMRELCESIARMEGRMARRLTGFGSVRLNREALDRA